MAFEQESLLEALTQTPQSTEAASAAKFLSKNLGNLEASHSERFDASGGQRRALDAVKAALASWC